MPLWKGLTFSGRRSTDFTRSLNLDTTFDAGSGDSDAIVAATPFSFAAGWNDSAAVFLGLDVANSSEDELRMIGRNMSYNRHSAVEILQLQD